MWKEHFKESGSTSVWNKKNGYLVENVLQTGSWNWAVNRPSFTNLLQLLINRTENRQLQMPLDSRTLTFNSAYHQRLSILRHSFTCRIVVTKILQSANVYFKKCDLDLFKHFRIFKFQTVFVFSYFPKFAPISWNKIPYFVLWQSCWNRARQANRALSRVSIVMIKDNFRFGENCRLFKLVAK